MRAPPPNNLARLLQATNRRAEADSVQDDGRFFE